MGQFSNPVATPPRTNEVEVPRPRGRILELPVRLGGLGIVNWPSTEAKSNYQYSKRITRPLTEHIIEQKHELPDEAETLKIKKQVVKDKLQKVEQQTKDVLQDASEEMQRAVKSSQE